MVQVPSQVIPCVSHLTNITAAVIMAFSQLRVWTQREGQPRLHNPDCFDQCVPGCCLLVSDPPGTALRRQDVTERRVSEAGSSASTTVALGKVTHFLHL